MTQDTSLMHTYKRLPVSFERGAGAWLTDTEGRHYLDALSGIAVCNLGHAHPSVTEAIRSQAQRLVHTSNLYGIPLQADLGARLCDATGMERVFFCNSGTEANEAAIKLARLHGHNRGIELPRIIVAEGAFHGRTLAALSATANPAAQAGFAPLLDGFVRVPFDDLDAVERAAEENDGIVAVLVEPIQGEGGVVTPSAGYLPGLREICDRQGWLLMLDEVQCGVARSGEWLAQQRAGIRADVTTLAKALGNGVPVGACLARGEAADTLQPGSHGSTFGGNPLACSAALAVLDAIERDSLTTRADSLGSRMRARFRDALADDAAVKDVRGSGLMIGIELDRPCAAIVGEALARGLLINVTAQRVIRLLPPLIITEAEAERICTTVIELIREFTDAGATAGRGSGR